MQIAVDGTVFNITSSVDDFCENVARDNRAVLRFAMAKYPDALRLIQERFEKRYGPSSRQFADVLPSPLHCASSSCLKELPRSFLISLMGMSYANMRADASGGCPHCGSQEGFLVYEHFAPDSISQLDVDAIGNYWLDRARRWWAQQKRAEAICDLCNATVPRGAGYLMTSSLICDRCGTKALAGALGELRRDPHYFGSALVRKARPFRAEEI